MLIYYERRCFAVVFSLEEEGLLARWLMLTGILITLGSVAVEALMFFLQGGISYFITLSLISLLWYFGVILVIFGLVFWIGNKIFPTSDRKRVEANFRIKLHLIVGILIVVATTVITLVFAFTGGMDRLMIKLSILRLLMIIGAGIFIIGILTSVKYFFGLILRWLWPFKKKKQAY